MIMEVFGLWHGSIGLQQGKLLEMRFKYRYITHSDLKMKKEVEKTGATYDPSYEYRIVDGKIQRRLKGGK